MKNFCSRRGALRGLALAGVSLSLFPAAAFAEEPKAAAPAPRLVWKSDEFTVHAVNDKAGEMPNSRFFGPASPEEREKYFVNGLTPAGVNCFLVTELRSRRRLLVDTGFGDSGSRLLEGLAALGAGPDEIDTVLLTHMHIDHAGGLTRPDGSPVFGRARIRVSAPELRYWRSAVQKADKSLEHAGGISAAKRALEAYAGAFEEFAFGDEILSGVKALDAAGHTPGHTAYEFGGAPERLIIAGDLVHAAALQFPMPDECRDFDMDRPASVRTRRRIMRMASDGATVLAGMHIPFPSAVRVKEAAPGFAFETLS